MFTRSIVSKPHGKMSYTARKLAIKLALLGSLVHVSLHLVGYQRTLGFIQRFLPSATVSKAIVPNKKLFIQTIRKLDRLVTTRSPFPANCLARSLALQWLMQRSGVETMIKIGFRRNESDFFYAHAWLEYDNRPLNSRVSSLKAYSTFS